MPRRQNRARKRFRPGNQAPCRLGELTDAAEFRQITFRTPRPVHYLEQLRYIGEQPPTKTVQVLLEALLAVAIDADRSMRPASHLVPSRAILAVLGRSARRGELEVAVGSLRAMVLSIVDLKEREAFRPKAFRAYEDRQGNLVSRERRPWRRRMPSPTVGFLPFDSLELVGSDIRFQVSEVLRRALSGQHQYGYLDLVAISNFRSIYTLPLYRLIVSRTREMRTKMPDGTGVSVSFQIKELAENASYRRQGGGFAAQIKRTVIDAAMRDFSRPRRPGEKRDEPNLPIRVRTVGDFAAFFVQIEMPSVERLPFLRRQTYDSGSVRRVSPRDDPRFQIPVGVLLKVERQYNVVDSCAANAWLIALHEMETHSDFTGNARKRRLRGYGLRKALESQPLRQVLYEFLVEEAIKPDLLDTEKANHLSVQNARDAAEFRYRVHTVGMDEATVEREAKAEALRRQVVLMERGRIRMRDALPVLPSDMTLAEVEYEVAVRCTGCNRIDYPSGLEAEIFPQRTVRESLSYWQEVRGCEADCNLYAVRIDKNRRYIDEKGSSAVPGR